VFAPAAGEAAVTDTPLRRSDGRGQRRSAAFWALSRASADGLKRIALPFALAQVYARRHR